MSRSTVAKSRADKAGKTASAPTPAVTHEIVPGKFNDQDWNLMQDHDDGDEFIEDIVEDVCSTALDIIYNSYIQRQLIPYTVLQAKDAILQIIEWQFLARDDGESNIENDPGWMEEEEPEPAQTDCWAQGSVPKSVQITPRPDTIVEEEEAKETSVAEEEQEPVADEPQQEPEVEEPGPLQKEETMVVVTEETHPSETVHEDTIVQEQSKTPSPVEQEPKEEKKKTKKYKKHKGPLKSAPLKKMTESLEDTEINMYMDEYYANMPPAGSPDLAMLQMPNSCHSILKLQNGRPPGNRDVLYDDHGNVVSVVRIDPERLPSHSVHTKYRIVKQGQESKNTNRVQTHHKVIDPAVEAAQARLEAMRTGKFINKQKLPKPPQSPKPTGRNARTSIAKGSMGVQASMLPPPLIDNMEVSPGVIVREGDRVKKGPKQRTKEMDLISAATKRGLKPVSKTGNIELVSLAEILDSQSILVKPLADSPVIPPIAQI